MTETTIKKRGTSTFHGGREGTLDSSGFVVLLIGVLGGGMWVRAVAGSNGILSDITMWIGAFVRRVVLRALAEIIRLQRKRVGLPYGGKISEAQETVTYTCGECGAMLHTDSRCESCGRTIGGSA